MAASASSIVGACASAPMGEKTSAARTAAAVRRVEVVMVPLSEAQGMVTAFILMNVERSRLRTIADDLLAIDGITEVYSVAGPFDIVAIARVKRHEDLNDLVTEHVAALEGIESTETLIAFKTFSRKDLGLLWDIGVD